MRKTAPMVLALLAVAACKPKGSCDQRADPAKMCTEPLKSTLVESAKRDCPDDPTTHVKGTWSDGPCEREGAIAACETNYTRNWYFAGGRASKREHVAHQCNLSGAKLIDTKGKKLEGVTPEAPATVGDGWMTVTPQLAAVLDALAKINLPNVAPSGTIKPTAGKTLDAFTATIHQSDLSALGATTAYDEKETYPLKQGSDLRACAKVKRKQFVEGYSNDALKRAFGWCATLKHVLVVKMTKFDDVGIQTADKFQAGRAEGHVFAFDLPSGTAIGGYSWKAQSSAKAKSDETQRDFRENIERALNAGVTAASPTATVRFDL